MGQVETDEIYVGVDRRGAQYVFPVQAKGGTDKLSIVQIEQDFALCTKKFPDLICRAIAAQFMEGDIIALFSFETSQDGVALASSGKFAGRAVGLKFIFLPIFSERNFKATDEFV